MHRAVAFVLVLVLTGFATTALADDVPGIPGLSISSFNRVGTRDTPAAIPNGDVDSEAFTWHQSSQGQPGNSYIQCVHFRVQSRKAIATAQFRIEFLDEFQQPQFTWDIRRRGNFSPGQLVGGRFDPSTTYTNQGDQPCFLIPVARDLKVAFGRVTRARIETTDVLFTDGTVWHAGQSWDQAYATDGSHFPPLRMAMRWTNQGRAPLDVVNVFNRYDLGGKAQECVSFRNVGQRVATRVQFTWQYVDAANRPVTTVTGSENGTYTPPVTIENQCWTSSLTSDQIKLAAFGNVRVTRVDFNDGTQWTEGQDFTRAWGTDGSAIAPRLVPGGGAVVPGAPPPVIDGGGGGGGMRFGAIALDPSATIWALAQDRESAALAQVDAIDRCNAKVGAATCSSPLQFGGGAAMPGTWFRCGAIAVVRSGMTVVLTGTANTAREAEAQALTKAGSSSGNATILTSGCNSQ